MADQLALSIARIFTAEGEIVGAGFLMPEKRILTYTDVVIKALALSPDPEEMPTGNMLLDFPLVAPGEKIKARAVFWQPESLTASAVPLSGRNIAILEMEGPPPDEPSCDPAPRPTEGHYLAVSKLIKDGRVVPFLGAGASLFNRPAGLRFSVGAKCLPSGGELAEQLGRSFGYMPNDVQDLLRVSQYVSLVYGSGPLYEALRKFFIADYEPTDLHLFFARLPGLLREKKQSQPYQLIVTTNYDDMLENAFKLLGEPFDLVSYVADGPLKGKFLHQLFDRVAPDSKELESKVVDERVPEARVRVIDKPNEDQILGLKNRTVILKIHGAVDRINPDQDSYVITEDHYIDYLTRADIANLLPVTLAAILRRSHFLFLGYSLRDWNLRVILQRIWGERKLSFKSWSIQANPNQLDQEFWKGRGVDILDSRLEDYIPALEQKIGG